jgi:hypothetical protein
LKIDSLLGIKDGRVQILGPLQHRPQIDVFPVEERAAYQRDGMILFDFLFLDGRWRFGLRTHRRLLIGFRLCRLSVLLFSVFDAQPEVGVAPLLVLQPEGAIVNAVHSGRFAEADAPESHRFQSSYEVLVALGVDAPFPFLYHLRRGVRDLVLITLGVRRGRVHGLWCYVGGALGVSLVGV